MDTREVYRGAKSDYYTHCHDLPPQIGGCRVQAAGVRFKDEIDGKDGEPTGICDRFCGCSFPAYISFLCHKLTARTVSRSVLVIGFVLVFPPLFCLSCVPVVAHECFACTCLVRGNSSRSTTTLNEQSGRSNPRHPLLPVPLHLQSSPERAPPALTGIKH